MIFKNKEDLTDKERKIIESNIKSMETHNWNYIASSSNGRDSFDAFEMYFICQKCKLKMTKGCNDKYVLTSDERYVNCIGISLYTNKVAKIRKCSEIMMSKALE